MERDWRKEKPTKKQIDAISNMKNALGWTCFTPKTKGECSDLISEMQKEIEMRLTYTGYIGNKRSGFADSDYGDFGMTAGDMINY